jgi:hypothetical protein
LHLLFTSPFCAFLSIWSFKLSFYLSKKKYIYRFQNACAKESSLRRKTSLLEDTRHCFDKTNSKSLIKYGFFLLKKTLLTCSYWSTVDKFGLFWLLLTLWNGMIASLVCSALVAWSALVAYLSAFGTSELAWHYSSYLLELNAKVTHWVWTVNLKPKVVCYCFLNKTEDSVELGQLICDIYPIIDANDTVHESYCSICLIAFNAFFFFFFFFFFFSVLLH